MTVNYKKIGQDVKLLSTSLIPRNRSELILFCSLLIFYLSYGLFLSINTSIIDSTAYMCDIYFSFDNPTVFKDGSGFMGAHPLLVIFSKPLLLIGKCLILLFGYKAKTIASTILCASLISMSSVYIYRYLRQIVEIDPLISLLLSLFFAIFSTNLILSFTPESYTLSAFLLSFSCYFYSAHIQENRQIPFLSSLILCITLGGVTITNFAKGCLPVLFLNESRRLRLKKVAYLCLTFFVLFCLLNVARVATGKEHLFGSFFDYWQTTGAEEKPIAESSTNVTSLIDQFFGAPMLFPAIISSTLSNLNELYPTEFIDLGEYRSLWQYVFIATVGLGIVFALIRNAKNKLVRLLCCLFSIDIIIHCLLGFGAETLFIYGSHWIYIVPCMLGWLYKSLKEKAGILFTSTLIVLTAGLFYNNFVQMSTFINFAVDMFP